MMGEVGGTGADPVVVELPLLVAVRQLAALESIAARQGTTVGRNAGRAIEDR
jgi:hypothetical protein